MSRSGSILKCVQAFLLLYLLGAMPQSLACSCIGFEMDGFIHPDVTVLPANARGVLFLAPADMTLAPAMFTVAAGSGVAAGKATIEPVILPAAHPLSARLPQGSRLVRVGVEGGFAAGMHYTVGFDYGKPHAARHDSVSFDIDPAPFDLAVQRFAIRLDGPARRTMLALESGSGSCSSTEAALVQDFHIQVPAPLQRYLPALSLLSEGQDARPGAAYAPVEYRLSLCTPPSYDHGALQAPQELLYRDCRAPVDRVHLRAWVGMLEVDARMVAAEPAVADFTPARATTCSPYGMLREAIERGNSSETATLACALGRWGEFRQRLIDLDKEPVPTPAQWRQLVRLPEEEIAACGMAAFGEMLTTSRPGGPAFLTTYLALAKERLRSHDQAVVAATLNGLVDMQSTISARQRSAWPAETLLPFLPELLLAVDADGPGTSRALKLIGSFGPMARNAVPHLREVVEQERRQAGTALEALASIVPDDPAFQQSLIGWAHRPALGATPALVFARVAGTSRPQDAVALLLPLVQADNLSAIDALAELGPAAAPATAVLLAKMDQGPDKYVRAQALRAAIRVAADEAEAASTLSRKLLATPDDDLFPSDYVGLTHFKAHAADFIPVLRHMIRVYGSYRQDELRAIIVAMALTRAQQRALLDRLDHHPSSQPLIEVPPPLD